MMLPDSTDLKILRILQQDAFAKLKEISLAIDLSITPTHDRIKKLESEGIIQKYVGHLNRKKLELGLMVHCHVTLDKQTKNNFSEFERIIVEFPEVISCSLVSGSFDYYIKIITKDMETYNTFYQQKLACLPMVAHINSLIVMNEIKETTALPI